MIWSYFNAKRWRKDTVDCNTLWRSILNSWARIHFKRPCFWNRRSSESNQNWIKLQTQRQKSPRSSTCWRLDLQPQHRKRHALSMYDTRWTYFPWRSFPRTQQRRNAWENHLGFHSPILPRNRIQIFINSFRNTPKTSLQLIWSWFMARLESFHSSYFLTCRLSSSFSYPASLCETPYAVETRKWKTTYFDWNSVWHFRILAWISTSFF